MRLWADGTLVFLKENIAAVFAPELETRPEHEGSEVLAAMDTASSWEAWERMRWHSDLPVATSQRIMKRTLTALLLPQR